MKSQGITAYPAHEWGSTLGAYAYMLIYVLIPLIRGINNFFIYCIYLDLNHMLLSEMFFAPSISN